MNKRHLIFALVFPILVLAALIIYKQVRVMIGKEIILPISGFDPRDILSGHFLIYRIDYGIQNNDICRNYDNNNDAYICLKKDSSRPDTYFSTISPDKDLFESEDEECFAVIKGKCKDGLFTAGIERFFIPEGYAYSLDSAVRNSHGKIVLSVTKGGSAAIKDLLIDGKPWREYKD
jgi:uncharacterized membrane-anchored protein